LIDTESDTILLERKEEIEPPDERNRLIEALAQTKTCFARIIARLRSYTTPQPTEQDTRRLMQELQKLISNQPRFRVQMESHTDSNGIFGLLQLILRQISIFETSFWFVSVTVMVLGSYLILQLLGSTDLEPFLLQSPLVVAGGVAYAFRGMDERINELEDTVTIGWQQLALARMVIIVDYNNLIL
jgi:hypothetical protein